MVLRGKKGFQKKYRYLNPRNFMFELFYWNLKMTQIYVLLDLKTQHSLEIFFFFLSYLLQGSDSLRGT